MHVSVGSVTMRITDAAARELRDALTRAVAVIDSPRQSFAPVPAIHLVDSRGADKARDGDKHGDDDPEDGGPQLH